MNIGDKMLGNITSFGNNKNEATKNEASSCVPPSGYRQIKKMSKKNE